MGLLVIGLVAGCATGGSVRPAPPAGIQVSDALSLALRSGLTRYDGALKDQAIDEANVGRAPGTHGVRTAGKVIDGSLAATLFSTGSDVLGGLMLGNFLFAPSGRDHPATMTHIIAWMPQTMAPKRRDAKAAMKTVLRDAVVSGLPPEYSIARRTLMKRGKPVQRDLLEGPGCEAPTLCQMFFVVNNPQKVESGFESSAGVASWEWRNHDIGSDSSDRRMGIGVYARKIDPNQSLLPIQGKAGETPLSARDFALAASIGGPSWLYSYLAPTETQPEPLVVHQGQVRRFIKPGAGS
ncbi:hypothetical protein DEH80_01235 [Abyssibacter profundi]|uniref:Uncharacterized protein n=2 Tax=Abyssibacter profundi TaxID=2182787 RepID=A0A363UQL4_9GAMM|nr:hypothetical protein DEH80_01235 [Abyssibacter profundi]